jgi:hypothetical protein
MENSNEIMERDIAREIEMQKQIESLTNELNAERKLRAEIAADLRDISERFNTLIAGRKN